MDRRVLAGLLLAAAVFGALVLVRTSPPADETAPAEPGPRGAAVDVQPSENPTPAAAAVETPAAREPVEPAASEAAPAAPADEEPKRYCYFEVRREEDGVPCTDAWVEVVRVAVPIPVESLGPSRLRAIVPKEYRQNDVLPARVVARDRLVRQVRFPLLAHPTEDTPFVVTLGPGVSVTGRVVDADGEPKPHRAIVAIVDPKPDDSTDFSAGTTVRGDGRFTLHGLPVARDFSLLISGLEEPRPRRGFNTPDAAVTLDLGDVRLPRLETAVLRLRSGGGEAGVPGATVIVHHQRDGFFNTTNVEGDDEGNLQIPTHEREIGIEVWAANHLRTRVSFPSALAGQELRVDVPRAPAFDAIVVDHEGRPVAGAEIRYGCVASAGPGFGATWQHLAVSGDDGRFDLQNLELGELELQAEEGERRSRVLKTLIAEGMEALSLRVVLLPPTGIRVRALVDGQPTDEGKAYALPSAPYESEGGPLATIRPNGRHLLHLEPNAPHDVHVEVPNRARVVLRRVVVPEGEVRDLEVELPVPASVTVRLTYPDGSPCSGASVTLTDAHGEACTHPDTTDEDGRAQLADTAPGEYAVSASLRSEPNLRATLRGPLVISPERVRLDSGPSTLEFHVLQEAGASVEFRLRNEGLPGEPMLLSLDLEREDAERTSYRLSAWPQKGTRVRFVPAGTYLVSGTVKGRDADEMWEVTIAPQRITVPASAEPVVIELPLRPQ